MNIVPLEGYCIVKPCDKLSSLESETAEATGLHGFTVVDSKAGRNDAMNGKTRVRKFIVLDVYEESVSQVKSYVGKNVYCLCFENENENNIIVDRSNGDRLWFMPISNILGYEKE